MRVDRVRLTMLLRDGDAGERSPSPEMADWRCQATKAARLPTIRTLQAWRANTKHPKLPQGKRKWESQANTTRTEINVMVFVSAIQVITPSLMAAHISPCADSNFMAPTCGAVGKLRLSPVRSSQCNFSIASRCIQVIFASHPLFKPHLLTSHQSATSWRPLGGLTSKLVIGPETLK